jgi:hypothetical protein
LLGPSYTVAGEVELMKFKTAMVGVILITCCAVSSSAAPCKPDFSSQDKISKEAIVTWFHNLTGIGFWKSMIASDIDVIAVVGRYGNVNAINIQIVNTENDRDRAAFDSRYRAAQGDRIVFGFRNGEPLTFVATRVNNQAQIQQAKGLVMTVVLSAELTDDALARMRTALTTRQIDAVRIMLASGMIERSIDESNGKAMAEKFSCFYEYLDGRGINLSAGEEKPVTLVNDPAKMAAVQGRYVRKDAPADVLELRADGTSALFQDGFNIRGTYAVKDDAVTLVSPDAPGHVSRGVISGDTIKDDDGKVWQKLTEEQRAASPPMPQPSADLQTAGASVVGKYIAKGVAYYLQLNADGTISCGHFDGSAPRQDCGTYRVLGPGVSLKVANNPPTNLMIKGSSLVGKIQVWEKQIVAPSADTPHAATTPVTIRLGMTPQEVEQVLRASPQKVIDLGEKKIFIYTDMKITFMAGKVTDVQ